MKLSKDYWYHYSETDLRESPQRRAVQRPPGTFLFDGCSLPRASMEESAAKLSELQATTTAMALQATVSTVTTITTTTTRKTGDQKHLSTAPSSPAHKSNNKPQYRPQIADKYYNRFPTPKDELLEDLERDSHHDQLALLTHVYHDPYRVGKSVSSLTASQRLAFPSFSNNRSLQRTWTKRVTQPVDVVHQHVQATLRTAESSSCAQSHSHSQHQNQHNKSTVAATS
jgi:hypothetical protein